MNSAYSPLGTDENTVEAPQLQRENTTDNALRPPLDVQVPPLMQYSFPPRYDEQVPSQYRVSRHTVPNEHGVDALPSYESATKLPTYQDVEKQKEDEARMDMIDELFGTNTVDSEDDEARLDGILVGSDCMFFFAFFIGFFFNWVGLFIGYFFMFNLAGRYGAVAGFGTSMIKWLLYLKYSDCCQDILIKSNVYVYLLVNLLALVITLKGIHCWLTVRPYAYSSNGSGRPTRRHASLRN